MKGRKGYLLAVGSALGLQANIGGVQGLGPVQVICICTPWGAYLWNGCCSCCCQLPHVLLAVTMLLEVHQATAGHLADLQTRMPITYLFIHMRKERHKAKILVAGWQVPSLCRHWNWASCKLVELYSCINIPCIQSQCMLLNVVLKSVHLWDL